VFTLPGGRPVTRHDWSLVWAPAARAAGLPPREGLHLIRHGESVKSVQARLGHASAMVTLDTYGHLWPDADHTTRAAVEAALGARTDPVRTEAAT